MNHWTAATIVRSLANRLTSVLKRVELTSLIVRDHSFVDLLSATDCS